MHGPPLIIYIPGLKPKPRPDLHRTELLRCLFEGVRRRDPQTAADLEDDGAFELVSWTYDFYGEYRDIALDLDDIQALLVKERASEEDVLIASSWQRRLARWIFSVADYLPFLVPQVATEEVEVHLRDFYRYARNRQGCADDARDKLKRALRQAAADDRPVLLLAHSMGSVIAWDSLWQMSHIDGDPLVVDLLLTAGSPLGQKIVQRHLLGRRASGTRRFPRNIRRWANVAAIGELTAVDRVLKNDFGEMIELGLVPDIDDREVFNFYRMHGSLNVHVEYGYLINDEIARIVSDWWNENKNGAGSAGSGPGIA